MQILIVLVFISWCLLGTAFSLVPAIKEVAKLVKKS